MKNNHRSRGNRKEQIRRRRERLKDRPKRQKYEYELIDGNKSFYPVAECLHYGGYLTTGLMETHRCLNRQCQRLVMLENGEH